MVYKNIKEMIGNTPILKIDRYVQYKDFESEIFVKLEGFNPTGSVKDRAVLGMIEALENEGKINSDTIIIEPTSGNTGISIASIAVASKYKSIIVMPESMSIERRKIITSLGQELVLTKASLGMSGAIAKANELHNNILNSVILNQFDNQNNYLSHYQTAKELIRDLNNIDILIAGVGTGGTITGIAKYFKENNINIKIVAVEPAESSVLSNNKPGSHKIQGIGAGFIPSILDLSLIDEIVTVSYLECVEEMHIFSKTEGLLIGISSGAVLAALRKLNIGNKKVALIFPDLGYKYLSSDIYK